MSEVQLQPTNAQTPDAVVWVDEHGDYLFKYALFRLRDAAAAEDAVQETFLAGIKAYAKYEGRGSERTWLVGILKHKITDYFRKSQREAPLGETEDDETFDHREFFTRTDGWDHHWNTDYAPTDWHATPEQLVEQGDFWKVFGRANFIDVSKCCARRSASDLL